MMRVETIQRTVYTYVELSDQAKEKARQWYLEGDDGFWAEAVYEDAANIASLFGLDIRTRRVNLKGGGTRLEPNIYYSGFWSQGDGACFEGYYEYKAGSVKAVKSYAPLDTELHGIVERLAQIQKTHFYRLTASTKHRGHYYHSGCMSVEVEHSDDRYRDIGSAEDEIRDELRRFADWIYDQLEKAYDWYSDDEQVAEYCMANQYEFDEYGNVV